MTHQGIINRSILQYNYLYILFFLPFSKPEFPFWYRDYNWKKKRNDLYEPHTLLLVRVEHFVAKFAAPLLVPVEDSRCF